jgi:SAM-dependent methyltransferase
MSHPPLDYGYVPGVLPAMIDLARRQRAKDRLVVEKLADCFRPGPILEIGAGCGQLTDLLRQRHLDVTASDVQPFFVDYMVAQGLPALVVDALDLSAGIEKPYDNIFSQSISTLINPDPETIRRTYESVRAALNPGGRFVFILPSRWGEHWSTASDHEQIAEAAGLLLLRRFRSQALPSPFYARLPIFLLRTVEGSIGRVVGIRWVLVFARPS